MLVSEALQDVRNRLSDRDAVGDFDDNELVSYMNQAIHYIGNYLVAAGNPLVVKEMAVCDGDDMPDDYIKTCGSYWMRVTGRKVMVLRHRRKPLVVRYFYELPTVTGTHADEELPLDNYAFTNAIVQMTVLFAMNQQRFNIQQDQAVTTECLDIANKAFGHSAK